MFCSERTAAANPLKAYPKLLTSVVILFIGCEGKAYFIVGQCNHPRIIASKLQGTAQTGQLLT